jgi:threonine dehydrogenase-like Zn-dependent dehydrogenase
MPFWYLGFAYKEKGNKQRPEPDAKHGGVLVQMAQLGICGTDREIIDGEYGAAPPGAKSLVLGHESVGRVFETGDAKVLKRGDWVVPMVRHPDPVPCVSCAAGEWDMCRNGRYTEHGIKELDGFGAERLVLPEDRLIPVPPALGALGVLLEPASIVAKAWEQIARIGARSTWAPRHVLVTGAGTIGLLAALFGVQRGLHVTLFDRRTTGIKPALAAALGARYLTGSVDEVLNQTPFDVVLECTGAASVVICVITGVHANGIVCLLGVSNGGVKMKLDVGSVNREVVLDNEVVFGSVNANRRHYEAATHALCVADPVWLSRLITRRMPLEGWARALEREAHGVKTVLELS